MSRVMRPKSMATVVVVLPWIWLVSSTPTLAVVMAASVVSGMISETAPTKVVLPTPKPPAMTILTGVGALDSPRGARSILSGVHRAPSREAQGLGGRRRWRADAR